MGKGKSSGSSNSVSPFAGFSYGQGANQGNASGSTNSQLNSLINSFLQSIGAGNSSQAGSSFTHGNSTTNTTGFSNTGTTGASTTASSWSSPYAAPLAGMASAESGAISPAMNTYDTQLNQILNGDEFTGMAMPEINSAVSAGRQAGTSAMGQAQGFLAQTGADRGGFSGNTLSMASMNEAESLGQVPNNVAMGFINQAPGTIAGQMGQAEGAMGTAGSLVGSGLSTTAYNQKSGTTYGQNQNTVYGQSSNYADRSAYLNDNTQVGQQSEQQNSLMNFLNNYASNFANMNNSRGIGMNNQNSSGSGASFDPMALISMLANLG